jgi:hypothetical protein
LKVKEEERAWVSYVIKLVEDEEGVKVEEGREGMGQRVMMSSGSKSENLILDGGCFGGSNNNGYRE